MPQFLAENGYSSLTQRLNRFPQGAPPSELLTKILALLFTEQEAALVGQLPMRPFSPAMAAQLWGVREVDAYRILAGLAERALLLDAEHNGEMTYVLPPPMSGFFEFSMMRVRGDIDQVALSELFYQYLNMEEEFIGSLFLEGKTRLGRIMVDEESIPSANVSRVLDYERASEVIKKSSSIAIGSCYCRQKMHHLGRACSAAKEIRMIFDGVADPLIRHGHARKVDKAECLDLLQQAKAQNLVQFAENVQGGVSFICNCCSCCCEPLVAARKFCSLQPVQTTNYVSEPKPELCGGCGRCIDVCPVEAVSLVSANDPQHPWMRKCVHDATRCLGCGLCVRVCNSGAVSLVPRTERVITPADSAHRIVLMAIERGKLQHLIWDNQALLSHRALSAIFGAILKLPPVKQALAESQLGSRYLHAIIQRRSDRSHRPEARY